MKVLVVIMGLMILAGLMLLGALVASRMTHRAPAGNSIGAPPQMFSAAPIELPAGARIETIAAGTDRLIVDIVLADGNRQFVVIDLASGRRLGVIPLQFAR